MPVLPSVDGLFVGVQTFRQRLLGHPQTRLSKQREGVDRISHKAGGWEFMWTFCPGGVPPSTMASKACRAVCYEVTLRWKVRNEDALGKASRFRHDR